jgi:hypothetical protein
MRRTSINTGQNIAKQAMDMLNQASNKSHVSIEHDAHVASTSHVWVPIYDRVGFFV